jgi:hypothetical protein
MAALLRLGHSALKASDAVQADESPCTASEQRILHGARQGQALRARFARP